MRGTYDMTFLQADMVAGKGGERKRRGGEDGVKEEEETVRDGRTT